MATSGVSSLKLVSPGTPNSPARLPPAEAWLEGLAKDDRDLETGADLEEEIAELTAELILGCRLEMMFLTRPPWLEPKPELEPNLDPELKPPPPMRGDTELIRGATETELTLGDTEKLFWRKPVEPLELEDMAPWTAEDIWGWMEARIWAIRSDWDRPEGLAWPLPEVTPEPAPATSSIPARGPL